MNIDGSTASTTRHVVAGLTNEIEYTFQIRAENQKGASSPSEPASATPIDLPDRPTGLIAGGGDQRVALVWDDSHYESITGYQYFQLVNQMSMAGSDSDVGERFADAVVMEGDTIVVSAGCHLTDEGDPAGGVYVFTRPSGGGSWVEETVKLTASDGALDDEFGLSIAITATPSSSAPVRIGSRVPAPARATQQVAYTSLPGPVGVGVGSRKPSS